MAQTLIRSVVLATLSVTLLAGCNAPSTANIKLRKSLQDRDVQIDRLNRQHDADLADVKAARSGPTTNALPSEMLGKLFTTHGLSFGRLTAGADLDPNKPGDDAIKIYVVPTDDQDQSLKAAGSFHVDAYDLADGGKLIGRWDFDTAATRKLWYGEAMLYNYVLTCPFQQMPKHSPLTVHVTFHDELTGREYSQQREVNINLPPTTAP